MLNRFLTWFGETFANRTKMIVQDPCGKGPYLTRYFLLGARKSKYALMLHHFHRSDADRDLHDHPWPFLSLILSGGYYEETPLRAKNLRTTHSYLRNRKWYPPLSLLFRPATWIHRVVLKPGNGPVWTLVLRFSYERVWGFHTNKGFVSFKEYD